MVKLNKNNIPSALHQIISVAEKWGINDDYEREKKISEATKSELHVLISSIDNVTDEDLYGWLEGEESYSETPSEEYVSFTCLAMAIDSAKIELKKFIDKPFCY